MHELHTRSADDRVWCRCDRGIDETERLQVLRRIGYGMHVWPTESVQPVTVAARIRRREHWILDDARRQLQTREYYEREIVAGGLTVARERPLLSLVFPRNPLPSSCVACLVLARPEASAYSSSDPLCRCRSSALGSLSLSLPNSPSMGSRAGRTWPGCICSISPAWLW